MIFFQTGSSEAVVALEQNSLACKDFKGHRAFNTEAAVPAV